MGGWPAVKSNADGSAGHVIDLDAVVEKMDGLLQTSYFLGLADQTSFKFRVKAKHASDSRFDNYNQEIIIIDTPITAADGHSPGYGQTKLSWLDIEDVLNDDTYADGAHSFRYRWAVGNHTDVDWRPYTFIPGTIVGESDLGVNGNTIGAPNHRLAKRLIYAIQLGYVKTGKPEVFAARYVYVWPSDRPALRRIATYPLVYPVNMEEGTMANGVYKYRICDAPISGGLTVVNDDWKKPVKHAFEQWEVATDGLVEMTRVDEPCAGYNTPAYPMEEDGPTYLEAVEKKIAASHPNVDVKMIRGFLTGLPIFTQIRADNQNWNEVRIINTGDFGNLDSIHMLDGFPELSRDVGLAKCIFESSTRACTDHHVSGAVFRSADIFLNQRHLDIGDIAPSLPGEDDVADRSDVLLNKCQISNHLAYESLVHEAGHALGIGCVVVGKRTDFNIHHPAFSNALYNKSGSDFSRIRAMSWNFDAGLRCTPHPFDIMAIYAMYQVE